MKRLVVEYLTWPFHSSTASTSPFPTVPTRKMREKMMGTIIPAARSSGLSEEMFNPPGIFLSDYRDLHWEKGIIGPKVLDPSL